MGIDRSPAYLRGFILPLELTDADIWTAEASYTTAELKAGAAIPSGGEKLVLNTIGEQTSAIDIKTHKAGTPGRSKAGFIFKRATETDYYGDNSFNAITDFQFLKMKSSVPLNTYSDPSCLALLNGDLLLAYSSTEAVGSNGIVVKRMAADGSVFSSGSVAFNATTHLSTVTASNPAMCQLSDGSVILVFWANYVISTNLSNLYVYRSNDNGVNWDLVSTGALDQSLDRSVYSLGRISIGHHNGQILLIGSLTKLAGLKNNIIIQAASVNEGMTFTTIGTTADNIYCYSPSMVVCDDGFILSYITSINDAASTDGHGKSFLFPNAFFPFASRGALELDISSGWDVGYINTTSKTFETGALTTWIDEENNIFVLFRNIPTKAQSYGGNGGLWMKISTDQGETWQYAGLLDPGWIPPFVQAMNDDTEYLRNFSACSAKGRTWVFCQPETTAGTIDNSLLLFGLRGYSSITLPDRFQDADIYQQFGYNHTYIPFVVPDILPDWTDTISGVPVVELTTGGLKITTSTTSSIKYTYSMLSPIAAHTTTGTIARFVARPATGGTVSGNEIAADLYISDGAHSYRVIFRFSPTQIQLRDELGAANLATVTPNPASILTDTGVEILVALGNGRVSAWWRGNDHIDAKGWNLLASNAAVADGGAGANNYLSIGNQAATASGSAISYWGEVCIAYKNGNGGQFFPDLFNGFSTPSDLSAKLYPSEGNALQVAEGMFISTQDGPAQLSDVYSVSPASSYGIENLFHAQSPSPQNGWRGKERSGAGAVPAEFIPIRLDANGENIAFQSDMIGIHLGNINFKDFQLEGYDAGSASWQVIKLINPGILIKSTRHGSRLVADPTGAAPHPYFFHDELTGATAQIPGAPPVYREIRTNSEGSWNGTTTPRPATIVLNDTQASDPTASLDVAIFPKNVTVIINLNGAKYSALGIRISSQNTRTGDFRIGHLSIGPFHAIAPQYSHGREITFSANTETFDQPDGIIRTRNLGKGRRNFSINWSDPVDTSPLMPMGGSPSPDWFKGSYNGAAQAVASFGGIAFDILGYIRHMRGPDRPVVYLPSVKFADNSGEEVRVYNRELQHALVMLDDSASIDNAIGEELVSVRGEIFRIGSINMVEVI